MGNLSQLSRKTIFVIILDMIRIVTQKRVKGVRNLRLDWATYNTYSVFKNKNKKRREGKEVKRKNGCCKVVPRVGNRRALTTSAAAAGTHPWAGASERHTQAFQRRGGQSLRTVSLISGQVLKGMKG